MKKVLLTGGTSGVGRATLEILCESEEYFVDFTFANASGTKDSLELKYSNCRGYFCDFREQNSVDTLLELIENHTYDVLINNAYTGNLLETNFHKVDKSVFAEDFNNNVMPVIMITQAVLVGMRKQKSGRIVNVLSSAMSNPPLGSSSYASVKAYLGMLNKSWAKEYARFNISSNSILPSMMKTSMLSKIDDRIVEQAIQSTPNKELLSPSETAQIIFGLVNNSQKMTGQEILIDSGFSL